MRRTTDELLAEVPLFRGLSKKHQARISSLATRIDGQPGKVLTKEGEVGREFILLLEGELEVRRGDDVIAVREAPNYIGEIALIDERPRTATVVAKTPVIIDVIDVRAFKTMLHDEPEIAAAIKKTSEERLAELDAGSGPEV